jgi:hypothetical protein
MTNKMKIIIVKININVIKLEARVKTDKVERICL